MKIGYLEAMATPQQVMFNDLEIVDIEAEFEADWQVQHGRPKVT